MRHCKNAGEQLDHNAPEHAVKLSIALPNGKAEAGFAPIMIAARQDNLNSLKPLR